MLTITSPDSPTVPESRVLTCADIDLQALETLVSRYQLALVCGAPDDDIPGSYWQAPEAGLIDNTLYVRPDTPVHSALHEACHYFCMDNSRRARLDTNAGGDFLEECGVCYLQILLGERLPGLDRARLFNDMDAWGYSFRLGSTQAWFEQDAEDAREWLRTNNLIDSAEQISWVLRC